MTRWAKDVSPANVWPEYPRPQMVRKEWQSLNGIWDYAIAGEGGEWKRPNVENATYDPLLKELPKPPAQWDGKILVPFAIESALSGVGKLVRPNQCLWYRRTFEAPEEWRGRRLRLNFEAVDWHCVVWVNGRKVGQNQGGYAPFSLDITDALKAGGPQEITMVVWDPSNAGDQAVGKQALPEIKKGFRYTPTTGIWQPVWLEPVPETSIARLKVTPEVDRGRLAAQVELRGDAKDCEVELRAFDGGSLVASATGAAAQPLALAIPQPKLWSPQSPFLYDLQVTLRRGGKTVDEVASYFGMRKIEVSQDAAGVPRIKLNGREVFSFGPLDQGYWPDGVLTPPGDAAAKFDVQYLRDIGCNMVRVHVKVHPARWYYWCDRLGLMVWQDFVCMPKYGATLTPAASAQWQAEQGRQMDHLHNHPSIMMWIVFNEGWGQHDTERFTQWAMNRDPSRLVNPASGWADAGVGPIYDIHDYSFCASIAQPGQLGQRAMCLGECGGFNVIVPGHTWGDYKGREDVDEIGERGRESYGDAASWEKRYAPWCDNLWMLRGAGLCGAVYTQITDVEHECNGWLTYDREISKIPVSRLKALHRRFDAPPPALKPLVPLLAEGGAARYTTAAAPADWTRPGFDDSAWPQAQGAFGSELKARVPVSPGQQPLRVRRAFTLARIPGRAAVRVAGEGKAEVYLNGQVVKRLTNGLRADYVPVSMTLLAPEALAALRPGENVLAVEFTLGRLGSRDPRGRGEAVRFFDVGLFEPGGAE